jgi:FtsP/CotA-like multicopper oxidase with cupredoxin domain
MARLSDLARALTDTVPDPFATDPTGLPLAARPSTIALDTGGHLELDAAPVRLDIGGDTLRMLAYGGSIPGPTVHVAQGASAAITFHNRAGVPTTVHWHGLRLDNQFDGVPAGRHRGMQAPVEDGERFTYRLRFPDPGLYWYHPHIREDYSQELGLYGNILVEPSDPDYWPRAHRQEILVLDDLLVKRGRVAPFSRSEPNRTAMGRYGNTMLINGAGSWDLAARPGEVVRLYLTNTANVRPFRFAIAGATMKLIGGDGGRVEREALVEDVVLAPSERAVVDVQFPAAGRFPIEHRGPDRRHLLGEAIVSGEALDDGTARAFPALRANAEFAPERAALDAEIARDPDRELHLVALMPGMRNQGGAHGHHVDIEWEDGMALHNRMTTTQNMFWKLVEPSTERQNREIDWAFRLGDRVKLRIINRRDSDHPMQHPFHIHGQRFLVLSRDGEANDNLAWKDSVLIPTGQVIDLLVEMSNPGTWMAHCHIAEHLESGMMLSFEVRS